VSKSKWRCFHTFKSAELEHQGHVDVVLPNGDLRVQLFSFLTGEPISLEVWSRDSLAARSMVFYEDDKTMREAYDERRRLTDTPRGT
jgi:hypothetical protein